MLEWVSLPVVWIVMVGVAVWTGRAQRRHDSVSILMSAAPVVPVVVPLAAFTFHAITEADVYAGVVFPQLVAFIVAFCSVFIGPRFFVTACWERSAESLPVSVSVLQACHLALWALLTFLGFALAFNVQNEGSLGRGRRDGASASAFDETRCRSRGAKSRRRRRGSVLASGKSLRGFR